MLLLLAVVLGRSLAPADDDGASSGWGTFVAELPASQHKRTNAAAAAAAAAQNVELGVQPLLVLCAKPMLMPICRHTHSCIAVAWHHYVCCARQSNTLLPTTCVTCLTKAVPNNEADIFVASHLVCWALQERCAQQLLLRWCCPWTG
jgi:hypothetical protein